MIFLCQVFTVSLYVYIPIAIYLDVENLVIERESFRLINIFSTIQLIVIYSMAIRTAVLTGIDC
jgi:hypothetical protein